jgi:hypothetical protein
MRLVLLLDAVDDIEVDCIALFGGLPVPIVVLLDGGDPFTVFITAGPLMSGIFTVLPPICADVFGLADVPIDVLPEDGWFVVPDDAAATAFIFAVNGLR